MFRLPGSWVWDFWLADDGARYHLFFLHAPRALRDPDARHYAARIGHAVSDDLRTWERVPDALAPGDPPAFDDLATWTGSIIRHPDGRWFMCYTGATLDLASGKNVQSIGCATSTDLLTWHKAPGPRVAADARWYEKVTDGQWHDEAFRDPFVVADPGGDGWHLLITARANHGAADDRGVVGHAWSADLESWEPRPPLTEPGQGFGQLEVLRIARVAGRDVLVFSCLASDLSAARRQTGTTGGVWVTPAPSPLGPFDIAGAQQLTDDRLYVGAFVADRHTGEPMFLAFRNVEDGEFVGEIADPVPASWDGDRILLGPPPEPGDTWR